MSGLQRGWFWWVAFAAAAFAAGAVLPSAAFVWLLLIEVMVLLLWYSQAAQSSSRDPFARRLDQLLALLLPEAEPATRKMAAPRGQGRIRALRRYGNAGSLRASARRWRAPLEAIYAEGYQVASEITPAPGEVPNERELLQQTLDALRAERGKAGADLAAAEDPVAVLAYGLGAWPSAADLTSLEQLLDELGVSQGELRARFESATRPMATATENRGFLELAGASFVLGAAARIVELALAPDSSLAAPRAPGGAPTRSRPTQPTHQPETRKHGHAR